MKKYLRILFVLVAVFAIAPVGSVDALLIDRDTRYANFVLDTFNSFKKPDPTKNWDYWWRTIGSSIPLTGRVENQDCTGGPNNDTDCIFIQSEGYLDYARFRLRPGKPEGSFYFAQLSDARDAMSYGEPMRWLPQVNQPVVLTTRARYSPNFNAEGTGAANGTSGIGFWNMPTELLDEPPFLTLNPIEALWFTYSEADNLLFQGLSANYATGIFPTFTPIRNVNMSNWNNYSIVWSVNEAGVQNIKFFLNLNKVAEYDLPEAFGPLSLVFWLDSTKVGPNGLIISGPTEEQWMDLDYVSVVQPKL